MRGSLIALMLLVSACCPAGLMPAAEDKMVRAEPPAPEATPTPTPVEPAPVETPAEPAPPPPPAPIVIDAPATLTFQKVLDLATPDGTPRLVATAASVDRVARVWELRNPYKLFLEVI